MINATKTRFSLGRIVATPGAMQSLTPQDIKDSLRRHASGDWGEVCEEDREENDLSLTEGHRLLSVYRARNGETFWLITEADRSATTVLMPDEY
jgi:hypothetical protein